MNHENRPDERHDDLMELSSKLSHLTKAQDSVKKAAVFLVCTITVAVVPLMIAGVREVSRSVQKQETMVEQFTEFKEDFGKFQDEQKMHNERTSAMWYQGGWSQKFEQK